MSTPKGLDLLTDLALGLYRIGALKFGSFTLKSGLQSPFYIDMRLLVSHPDVLDVVSAVLAQLIEQKGIKYQRLAAIPYAALPIGVALSMRVARPMIYPRKEKKTYGTGQQIEGEYNPGECALIIDDVITKGDSKLEVISTVREAGLDVSDIVVVIDRESGGVQAMAQVGVTVHSALKLSEMLDILQHAGKLESVQRQLIDDWLKANS